MPNRANLLRMARPTHSQLALIERVVEMDAQLNPVLAFPLIGTAMCIMPGSKPAATQRVWGRRNGPWSTTWTAGIKSDGGSWGLPYGPKARLLLAEWAGVAQRTGDRFINLGRSENAYMRRLRLTASRGSTGSNKLVGEQVARLVHASLVAENEDRPADGRRGTEGEGMRIARRWNVWWDTTGENPSHPTDDSWIELSKDLADEINDSSFPVPLEALSMLSDSALAQDMLMFFAYRLFQLRKPMLLTWEMCAMHWGANGLPDAPRLRTRAKAQTKVNVLKQMPSVLTVYHQAKVTETPDGLLMEPSRPLAAKRGMGGKQRAEKAITVNQRLEHGKLVDLARPPIKVTATLGPPAPQLPFEICSSIPCTQTDSGAPKQ